MDPKTYDVRDFENDQQAEDAGYTVKLSPAEAEMLRRMPRKARRQWLVQKRKAERRAAKAKPPLL